MASSHVEQMVLEGQLPRTVYLTYDALRTVAAETGSGTVYITRRDLGKLRGLTRESIELHMKKLLALGLVEVQHRGPRPGAIRLVP